MLYFLINKKLTSQVMQMPSLDITNGAFYSLLYDLPS